MIPVIEIQNVHVSTSTNLYLELIIVYSHTSAVQRCVFLERLWEFGMNSVLHFLGVVVELQKRQFVMYY